MAFIQLEDFNGSIELVVFSEPWQRHREELYVDAVVGIRGKIDASRGDPKVIVEAVMQPENLPEIGPSELHIRIAESLRDEQELYELRSMLIDQSGQCALFLHTADPRNGNEVVIKASPHLQVADTKEVIESLTGLPLVEAVWHE
jgi:DNA polymerase-3 subunit alpha